MKNSLETYLADPSIDGFTLKYTVGNAKSGGQTSLLLYGDTGYRLVSTQTQKGKEVEYAGYREIQELTDLMATLLGQKLWEIPAAELSKDEFAPSIAVTLDGREDIATLDASKLPSHPNFAKAEGAIRDLIVKISKGEIKR